MNKRIYFISENLKSIYLNLALSFLGILLCLTLYFRTTLGDISLYSLLELFKDIPLFGIFLLFVFFLYGYFLKILWDSIHEKKSENDIIVEKGIKLDCTVEYIEKIIISNYETIKKATHSHYSKTPQEVSLNLGACQIHLNYVYNNEEYKYVSEPLYLFNIKKMDCTSIYLYQNKIYPCVYKTPIETGYNIIDSNKNVFIDSDISKANGFIGFFNLFTIIMPLISLISIKIISYLNG